MTMFRTSRDADLDDAVRYDPFAEDDDPPVPKLQHPDAAELIATLVERIEREAYDRGWADAQAAHLEHGVFYTSVTQPGIHRLHHNLGTAKVLLCARAQDLESISTTRPDLVRSSDGDENTVVIETGEDVAYPVKVKIVLA